MSTSCQNEVMTTLFSEPSLREPYDSRPGITVSESVEDSRGTVPVEVVRSPGEDPEIRALLRPG
jgi:hypothetical protein